jgi:hypothetical protein
MSGATAEPVELPLLQRRRELLLAGAVTVVIAALVFSLGPAPGDAPAHLYRTLLVRHGALVWDNFWYAGTYPLASYSLLYYLPAAVVGNVPLVFAAAVVSTMLFSAIASREWGAAALWPARVFGVLAAAPMFTGLYAYSLGFAAMLGALRALQLQRTWLAILLAGLTIGFSPLAFVFLCLILAAVAVSRRRLARRSLVLAVGLGAVAAIEFAALSLFSFGAGVYPFHSIDFASVLGVSALGVALARRAQGASVLVAFYLFWAIGSVILFLVPSPLGDNWTRLSAFVFPVMLLTAALARFRPRRLAVLALAAALAYNLVPYLLLVPYRLDNRPAKAAFWAPALSFLARHATPGFRVEVVPTAAHWEAYWIPRAGYPLARGWYRQLDAAANPSLYAKHLDATAYRHWLRSNAVEYVLLAATPLDWDGGPREAQIVSSRSSGLEVVFRSRNWTIYRLPHPTPLVTGPRGVRVTSFGHTTIRGVVSGPGRFLLRVHYNPYWQLHGAGCVLRGPREMTWLELDRSGPFALSMPATPDGLLDSLTGVHPGCRG